MVIFCDIQLSILYPNLNAFICVSDKLTRGKSNCYAGLNQGCGPIPASERLAPPEALPRPKPSVVLDLPQSSNGSLSLGATMAGAAFASQIKALSGIGNVFGVGADLDEKSYRH
jgi:hypothetical protein